MLNQRQQRHQIETGADASDGQGKTVDGIERHAITRGQKSFSCTGGWQHAAQTKAHPQTENPPCRQPQSDSFAGEQARQHTAGADGQAQEALHGRDQGFRHAQHFPVVGEQHDGNMSDEVERRVGNYQKKQR